MSLIARGITGGIGAYKAIEVARGLQKRGHEVVAIMTRSARRFVAPLTFEAITRRRVITDQWSPGSNADIEHISIATDISLLLIAPATANTIGKLANGIADDFLSSLYLATRSPVLIAPAMNTPMRQKPAVQRNLAALAARGVRFVEPGEGFLACGWVGKGRLAEPDDVVAAADQLVRGDGPLRGRRLIVSAGPTFEDLDPVRFVGNRSSGRMGYAIAAEADARGADVVLVSGPTALQPPAVREVVRVRRAAEMHDAMLALAEAADAIAMAAAGADHTLASWRAARGGGRPVLVGFAAETHDVVERARAKRLRKGIDLIVANDVSRSDAGFEVGTNAVTLIGDGPDETLALASKAAIAGAILDRLTRLLAAIPSPVS